MSSNYSSLRIYKMATVGRRARGVFLSLASIQTQAKNLYKCKGDGTTEPRSRRERDKTGASVLALRS